MEQVLNYIRTQRERYLEELKAYLAIPSISSDPEYAGAVQEAAAHTAGLLEKAGLEWVEVHSTAGHPVVTGQWTGTAGRPTLLIYGHYDVQPVDPLELWERNPFEAHIRDERIIARGAADDKGQLFMHLKAVEAIHQTGNRLPVNLKFVLEGEEEIASPSLPEFLKSHRELLTADVALVSDSAMWAAGVPAITYGLRGLSYLEVELTGPNRDLHSGTYGGAVANPAEMLARLLAQVKDEKGRILMPGFYDKVKELSPQERELLSRVPFDEEQYKVGLGVAELWGEAPYSPLERVWIRPTFEVNGIWGGFTGKGAKTVLPAKASAKVSMRLVPDQNPDEIADIAERFLKARAPGSVQVKVTRFQGGRPVVTSIDNPYISAAARALKDAFGREPLFIREGGSIPIVADFKSILGLDTVLVGFSLPDARTHSPNENLHLPGFFTGIESLVRMLFYIGEG